MDIDGVNDAVAHVDMLPDPPLAVALASAEPEVVAQAEAGIDAVAALESTALSVPTKERVGVTEREAEDDAQALPEGARENDEITVGTVLDVALREGGADGEKVGEIEGTAVDECELLPVVLPQAVKVAAAVPLPIALPQAVEVAVADAPDEPLPTAVPECVPEPEAAPVPAAVHVPPPTIVVVAHAVMETDNVGVLDANAEAEGAAENEAQDENVAEGTGEGEGEGVGVPLENIEVESVGVPLAVLVAQNEEVSDGAELLVGEALEVPELCKESVGALDALA